MVINKYKKIQTTFPFNSKSFPPHYQAPFYPLLAVLFPKAPVITEGLLCALWWDCWSWLEPSVLSSLRAGPASPNREAADLTAASGHLQPVQHWLDPFLPRSGIPWDIAIQLQQYKPSINSEKIFLI